MTRRLRRRGAALRAAWIPAYAGMTGGYAKVSRGRGGWGRFAPGESRLRGSDVAWDGLGVGRVAPRRGAGVAGGFAAARAGRRVVRALRAVELRGTIRAFREKAPERPMTSPALRLRPASRGARLPLRRRSRHALPDSGLCSFALQVPPAVVCAERPASGCPPSAARLRRCEGRTREAPLVERYVDGSYPHGWPPFARSESRLGEAPPAPSPSGSLSIVIPRRRERNPCGTEF